MTQILVNTHGQLKKAVRDILEHNRIAHDSETKGPSQIGGLHPFHGSRSFAHIIATAEDEYYFNFNVGGINPKYKKDLQPIFNDPQRICFYVNAIFDGSISYFDGIEIKCRMVDCAALARVEYNNHQPYGKWSNEVNLPLEYMAEYYDVQRKIDKVWKYIEEHDLYEKDANGNYVRDIFKNEKIPLFHLVPLELMFEYGCGDARTTFDLGTKIIKCINYKDEIYERSRDRHTPLMINVAQNEIKLTKVLLKMKIDGCKLWTDYVNKAVEHEEAELNKLDKEIKNLLGDLNPNSGKQLAEYLARHGVDVPRSEPTEKDLEKIKQWEEKLSIATTQKQREVAEEKIKTYREGRPKTDKKTLEKLISKNPHIDFLSKITEHKEAEKKLNTYYKNFLLFKDPNDIIHPSLNQSKAVTGRFSSSEPNFQNLHKEKWDGSPDSFMIRKSIIPKNEDYELFFFDYKGQEMYIMIDLAEDMEVIIDIKENGTDIYIAMGNIVYKIAGVEIDRAAAKALSLGVAYGQGKALIAKNLKVAIEKGADLKKAFLDGLKGVSRLNRRMMRDAEVYGKIHNPYGRVSYIEKGFEYKALNSLIQGTAADCTKTAMVKLAEELLEGKKSHMILQVHDELIFEIHKDEKYLIPEIARIMGEAYPHRHLPLKVDIERSKRSWGEKETYEAA